MMQDVLEFLGLTDCHVVYYAMGGPMDSCTHNLIGLIVFGGLAIFAVAVVVATPGR